jgi:hypothetical protein
VVSLLDITLCKRDVSTDHHLKACSYGDCQKCGWEVRMAGMDVKDSIQGENGEVKEAEDNKEQDGALGAEPLVQDKQVLVHFRSYENVRFDEKGNDDDEAKSSQTSRPTLVKQNVRPSVFLRLFQAALAEYQKHRFVLCYRVDFTRPEGCTILCVP